MRRSFSIRQVFVIALGAGLAVAVAPMAVDAASRAAGLKSKGGRAVAVDKKGRLAVSVKNRPKVDATVVNQPSVKVPDGVAVTNRPTVEIGNQPAVTVVNQPSELAVAARPGKLTATTRPPLDDVFNFHAASIQSLAPREVLRLPAGRRAAVTHLSVTVEGAGVAQETIAELNRYVRTSGTGDCGTAGWEVTPLRRIVLKTEETFALDLGAAPIVVTPDGEDRPVCVAMKLYQWVGDTKVSFGADGYLY